MLHRVDLFLRSGAFAVLAIVALASCSFEEGGGAGAVAEESAGTVAEERAGSAGAPSGGPGRDASTEEAGDAGPSTDLVYVFEPPSEESLAMISRPDLREELLAMADEDQTARGGSNRDGEESGPYLPMGEIDHRNTIVMQRIVEEVGWPTRSMVGDDGTRAAWLLVQHADHDPAWQKHCLSLMQAELDEDEVFPADVAYLTDRVRVNAGRPQIYGTQFHRVEGRLVPRPMEDPDRVNERRAEMGMGTLDEYRKMMTT